MKNKNEYKGVVLSISTFIHLIVITALYAYVWQTFYSPISGDVFRGPGNVLVVAVYFTIYVILENVYGGFKIGHLKLTDVLFAGLLSVVITNVLSYAQICLIIRALVSPVPLIVLVAADIAVLVIWGLFADLIFFKLFPPREILLIVGSEKYYKLRSKFESRNDKYSISASIDMEQGMDAVKAKALQYGSVILCDVEATRRNKLLKFCFENSIRVYVTPKISDVIMRGGDTVDLFDTPLVLCRNFGLTFGQKFVKRLMDILISGIGLIVASPIMIVIAIAIKAQDGGPVFFKQKRATLNGEAFDILKFRSMIVDADKGGFHAATSDDDRITRVGKIIRPFRLDELPQLINILKGDMSVVGPRPERVEHMAVYTSEIPEFPFRLKVKGGLTGYAQVYGKYNTTPLDKLKLDLMYIQNYSILLDIKLLLMTIKTMFQKESTEGFTDEAAAGIFESYVGENGSNENADNTENTEHKDYTDKG